MGRDNKMSRFSRESTNLKKVLSWKTRQVYFIYPFPHRLKLGKSLETCMQCQFFCARADILSEKNSYFGKHLLCKTRTDYAYKLCVQDFATGMNFSFNQCSEQESFAFLLLKVILQKQAYPDRNTRGVGKILDSYANPRFRLRFS